MTKQPFPDFVEAWNGVLGLATPDVHRRIIRWLHDRFESGDRRLLLLAFRNSGKSSLLALFAVWLLARDPNRRVLVLAAESMLATKMVRHARRVIELHPGAADLRGERTGEWASDRLTVPRTRHGRDPSLLARGITGNVTGAHADIVICDDVEVPNTSDTDGKRTELRERLAEIDYIVDPAGHVVYAGTPHTYETIYRTEPVDGAGTDPRADRPFLAGFARLVVPLVDAAGESVWPERFPPERVEAIRLASGPTRFASQMLLEPRDPGAIRLDPALLRVYSAELQHREAGGAATLHLMGMRLDAVAAWWDPSFAAGEGGDQSVVAAVFRTADGDAFLHDIRYLEPPARHDTPALDQCRQVVRFVEALHLPAIAIETNGVGAFLPDLLRRELAEAGVGAAVEGVRSRDAKDARIQRAFEARLAAGRLYAHERVLATPFTREMRAWRRGRAGADDGLDAVAGCLLGAAERLPGLPRAARRPEWRRGAGVFEAETDFLP